MFIKKTTNFAVLSEPGRFPLYYDIIKSIFHYWNRLEYLEKFPLLQNAYEQSKQLYNQNKSSWYGSLQRILQNFPTISQLKGKKISKNSLNRQIKEGFLELWKNQMKQYSEGKLRTYTTVKVHFGFENYLSVMGNFEHRRCLTKLRISAHRLHIETGKYSPFDQPKTGLKN